MSKIKFIVNYIINLPFLKSIRSYFAKRKLNKWIRSVGQCSVFFGMPGAGKTSFCAYITKLALLANVKIYSNVPIIGAIEFTKEEFGVYDFSNSIILIDEGSLFYDGRNFKDNFNQASLEYLKLLRHRKNSVFVFSQSLDVDIKFIRMSNNIFQIKKSLIPGFTTISKVRRKVDVDENTHKFEDFYYKNNGIIGLFTNKRFFRPITYKLFDSYDAPKLPVKIEKRYGFN